MRVWAIMATCGRHTLAERSLAMFIQQDYKGFSNLLIYNNSPEELDLASIPTGENQSIKLVNNHIDCETGERYNSLGAIYRDAIEHVPEDAEAIIHWDDDDLFLPNHITEGVKGLKRGQKDAYKPAKSYYRHPGGVELMSNTLEPSIFTKAAHIRKHGYSLTTSDQHLQWVNPLVYEGRIYVDDNGPATLIYNWGDNNIPTFKTSGNAGSPRNFDNYRTFSRDHGDGILTPWRKEDLEQYYNLVK